MTDKLSQAKRSTLLNLSAEKDKWGIDNSKTLRSLGTASLIGADLVDAYSTSTNEKLRADALGRQREEISSRANQTAYILSKKEDTVISEQTAAFARSGVQMEGSALNVLSDTLHNAMEEQMQARSQADYKNMQLEVERVLSEKRAEYAAVDALFSIGADVGMGFKK